jgi:REP element-mobilizing transposase RayT
MTQKHVEQFGMFHVTTVTYGRVPWCTIDGVPECLIDNLRMTAHLHDAIIEAFCVLPDHVHFLVIPGPKGLSAFVHSFKRNASRDIRALLRGGNDPPLRDVGVVRWQKGFHDERIRDDQQKSATYDYIVYNAWRHHLVDDPDGWAWSSLRFPIDTVR